MVLFPPLIRRSHTLHNSLQAVVLHIDDLINPTIQSSQASIHRLQLKSQYIDRIA